MSIKAAALIDVPARNSIVEAIQPASVAAEAVVSDKAILAKASHQTLDGLGSLRSLNTVIMRVMLATGVYCGASTLFVFALAQAVGFHMFGWGPLHLALANVLFVGYFTGIMLPFSMALAWFYRYKKSTPYQQRVIDLQLSNHEAFELVLGAALSITGAELISADEKTGEIVCKAPQRPQAAAQEIRVSVEQVNEQTARVTVNSQPMLNAFEDILFGFTLSVDGGRNKANVDAIASFLKISEQSY